VNPHLSRTLPLGSSAFVLAMLLARPAHAHLVTTGLGPIYDGVCHVLTSPDDLVSILAMATLAGLNGPTAGRRALFLLTGSWLIGGLAGFTIGRSLSAPVDVFSCFVLGTLIALDRRLSSQVVSALAIVVGVSHGLLNGVTLELANMPPSCLIGISVVIFILVALASGLVVSLHATWTRIAVRVAGSWVVAIGLLMLGWRLHGASLSR